jgi:hypothetical protein
MNFRIVERETVNGRRYVVQRYSPFGSRDLGTYDSQGFHAAAYRTRAEAEKRILLEQSGAGTVKGLKGG